MKKRTMIYYNLIVDHDGSRYYHTNGNGIFSKNIGDAKLYTSLGRMRQAMKVMQYRSHGRPVWCTSLGDIPYENFKGLIVAVGIPDPDQIEELM